MGGRLPGGWLYLGPSLREVVCSVLRGVCAMCEVVTSALWGWVFLWWCVWFCAVCIVVVRRVVCGFEALRSGAV